MLALIVAQAVAAPAAPPLESMPPAAPWPSAVPGRVLATPDWSDYRLYPVAARQRDQEGRVATQLLVDPQGRPSACRIAQSSGFAALDDGTCALMMTMRFDPARDADGRAVASVFARRVGWLLTSRRAFGSSLVTVAFDRVGDARPTCRVVAAEGPYAALWSATACSVVVDTGYVLHAAPPGSGTFLMTTRLDAGDASPIAARPWPDGTPIAEETIDFTVGDDGSPGQCTARSASGWGPRGLNNLSPCDRLLSQLWLKGKGQTGVLRSRVYRAAPAP